ncbi:MAG: DUF1194 domain-containing protein [Pseudomonadota bacterium]
MSARSRTLLARVAFAPLALAAVPAQACELALAFALDVSASVDAREYRQQIDGLAAALVEPRVVEAVLAQPGGIALAAYEWSGRYQQDEIVHWTRIETRDSLAGFVARLRAHTRAYDEFPTAIGYALGHGAVLMRSAPDCARRVIDISGDGVGNEGFSPAIAYREFEFDAITVNGLAIGGTDPEVIEYYRAEIPHGPDAFVEVARDFDDYPAAILRKLLREIEGPQYVRAE